MNTVTTTIACITTALLLLGASPLSAADQKYDLDISGTEITVASNQLSIKEAELLEYLKATMKEYYVVSKDDWTHNYSHVALGDSTGTIKWTEDDTKIWKWMIRPGGLASVTDENGITTYLAKVIQAKK